MIKSTKFWYKYFMSLSLGSESAVRNFCSVSPRAPKVAMDRVISTQSGETIKFPETSSATAYKRCK